MAILVLVFFEEGLSHVKISRLIIHVIQNEIHHGPIRVVHSGSRGVFCHPCKTKLIRHRYVLSFLLLNKKGRERQVDNQSSDPS